MNTNYNSLMRVGEILVEKGWITWQQLKKALALQQESGQRLGDILVQNKVLSRKELFHALASQSGMMFVDLSNVDAQKEAIHSVAKKLAQEYRIIPLVMKDKTLLIAIADPNGEWPEEKLRTLTDIQEIRTVLACPEDIEKALLKYYGPTDQTSKVS